jgi:hypothetical protein
MALPLARNADPRTSHRAAESLDDDVLTRQQQAILTLLRESPEGLTDRELTVKYFAVAEKRGWPITEFDSVRKRRSTLTTRGLVVSTTYKRDPRTHRDAGIWRVTSR